MDSSNITNYDVLVEPPTDGSASGDYQLSKHNSHVGNNRLEVFLKLYKTAYDTARDRGEIRECNKIVDKIVGTVCHQCVPRGRFLVSSTSENGSVLWNPMDENDAKALIHQVLEPRQQATNNSNAGASKDDEGLKRRRRSSLLRRSASEGMLSNLDLDFIDKKKVTRIDEAITDNNWKSTRSTPNNGIISLNRMDVILTDSGNKLDLDPNSQSVGNNRLHILIAMQAGKYKEASPDGEEKILDEVVNTVNMFWKGRFLVESELGYEELEKERSKEALRAIFAMRCGFKPDQRPQRRSVPAIVPPMVRPMVSKQASMSMISTVSGTVMGLPDMQDMRSAAVKSLQKQKARQNIASRLEKISRRNLNQTPLVQNPPSVPGVDMPVGMGLGMGMGVGTGGVRGIQKRESTVLGKIDPGIMEQLVADFGDADCDDDNEPLPPSNPNQFGHQFGNNFPGGSGLG